MNVLLTRLRTGALAGLVTAGALLGVPGTASAASDGTVPGVSPHAATSGGRSVDIDGDGHDDVLVRDGASGELEVWLGTGEHQEGGPWRSIQPLGRGWDRYRWFGAGNFNGDAYGDIVGVARDGTVSLLLNKGRLDGANTFAAPVVIGTGLQNADLIFTGDADHDGLDDIQARRRGTTITYTRHNDGGSTPSFAPAKELLRTASGVVDQKMGDFTLDGRLDVLSVKANGDTHVRDLSNGRSYYFGPMLANGKRIVIGDFYTKPTQGAPDILFVEQYPEPYGGAASSLNEHRGTFDPANPRASYGSIGGYDETGSFDYRDDLS